MRNIINRCSSRMGLAVALLVIFVIACQMLPGSLAVDKGPLAAGPTRADLVTKHSRASLRPELISLVARNGSDLSSFAVGNFTVNSLADPGDGTCDLTECTLREAIVAANANAGPDVIGFSVTGTINLTGALPPITDAVAINGPGAAQLTVRRDTGGDYRIVALMVNAPGVVTISGINITNGLASGSFPDSLGGGIANLASGTANISDCILSGNSAAAGGAVSSVRPDSLGPALTTNITNITNCVLNNNTAGSGGGIYNDSTLTITHSTLSGNKATTSGDGGGITQLTTGSTVITDSIISGNSALDSSGFGTGGGIHNNSILTIVRSTISGNSAGNNGGAISNNSGAVTITNSTLSGNTAGASGGGIANSNSVVNGNSSVNIMNSTISGNGAIFGGGIDNEHFVDDGQQQVKLTSTIVANSTVGPDVRGVITSQGYNIMGVTSGAIITPATGDQLGVSAAQLN